ncbi:MAG: response regulator [Psychrobium sp.]|nr:response regulator [Psychrobium sp.]
MSAIKKVPYEKLKVLLVDPQRPFQMMMRGILGNFGVTYIDVVDSGESAIRSCRAKAYDLLLVEYNLGSNKNGRLLLEELRTLRLIKSDALFIIVSAETDRAVVLGTMEMAPDDYIIKPFSQRLLDNRIQKAWSKRQAMKKIHHYVAQNDYPKAILTCRQLVKSKSRYNAFIIQMMTDFMCRESEFSEAEKILSSILKSRDLSWATINLARAKFGLQQYDEAHDLLISLLKKQGNNVEAIDLLAMIQLASEKQQDAKQTLRRSLELSPLSMKRHQLMVEVATATDDFALVKESYSQLLMLSRRSVHAGTEHLLNYTRSIINAVAHCEEDKEVYKLQNELNTALHRAKQEEGRQLGYHFSTIEGIILSQLQSVKGETLLSKKTLMAAIHTFCNEDDVWELPDELAPDTCITLLNVNDFEMAAKFVDQVDESSALGEQVRTRLHGNDMAEIKSQFTKITKLGIEAYNANNNLEALALFKQAIIISPVNSGAALNVVQAQIKLMQEKRKYLKLLMSECKDSFRMLNGMKLSKAHQKRYDKLQAEFLVLQNK